jgi:primase-polymerase (primpol)-like protein
MNDLVDGRVNRDNIPRFLKRYANWVCWKGSKVPINPKTGEWASVKEPDTWTDFKTAHRAYLRLRCDGLGFVFTPEVQLCGVDLDHCRDINTGEVTRWALKIVKRMRSYSEISPSGTGLHIIAQE